MNGVEEHNVNTEKVKFNVSGQYETVEELDKGKLVKFFDYFDAMFQGDWDNSNLNLTYAQYEYLMNTIERCGFYYENSIHDSYFQLKKDVVDEILDTVIVLPFGVHNQIGINNIRKTEGYDYLCLDTNTFREFDNTRCEFRYPFKFEKNVYTDIADSLDCMISGGYLVHVLLRSHRTYTPLPSPEQDIDFFVFNDAHYAEVKQKLMDLTYNRYPEQKHNVCNFKPGVYRNELQLVKKPFETPQELIRDFDIDTCKVAYYKGNLYMTNSFRCALASRSFRLDRVRFCHRSTITRVLKYIEKGFNLLIKDQTPDSFTGFHDNFCKDSDNFMFAVMISYIQKFNEVRLYQWNQN